jgi:flagellar protein FliS
MYYGNGMQRYRETDIGTMSPEKIVSMLYDRTIRDLEGAAEALGRGDRAEVNRLIVHSQAIITELRGALNHELGGEVAANLENIYEWLFRQHLSALASPTADLITDCVKVLEPLADAWRAIASGAAHGVRSLEAAAAGPDPARGTVNPGGVREPAGAAANRSLLSVTV